MNKRSALSMLVSVVCVTAVSLLLFTGRFGIGAQEAPVMDELASVTVTDGTREVTFSTEETMQKPLQAAHLGKKLSGEAHGEPEYTAVFTLRDGTERVFECNSTSFWWDSKGYPASQGELAVSILRGLLENAPEA